MSKQVLVNVSDLEVLRDLLAGRPQWQFRLDRLVAAIPKPEPVPEQGDLPKGNPP